MINLLKMDRYQLQHNLLYWYGMAGVFLLGFFTADTYLSEVMAFQAEWLRHWKILGRHGL